MNHKYIWLAAIVFVGSLAGVAFAGHQARQSANTATTTTTGN